MYFLFNIFNVFDILNFEFIYGLCELNLAFEFYIINVCKKSILFWFYGGRDWT